MPFHPRVSPATFARSWSHVPLPAALELAAYVDVDVRGESYGDPGNLLKLGPRVLLGAGVTRGGAPRRACA